MCVITALATAGAAIAGAVSSATTAVSTALGTTLIGGTLITAPTAAATAGTISAIGVTGGLTVGGALAATALVGGITAGGIAMYRSSRQSAKAQADAIKQLQQQSEETGMVGVSKTATTVQDNSRVSRTLSSLRISMIPQRKNNEEITQNVYGVDSNTVATSTQNMTGLNIATA
nr:MAG TPA: hypothetical protein [Caudoviricetes sp.]